MKVEKPNNLVRIRVWKSWLHGTLSPGHEQLVELGKVRLVIEKDVCLAASIL